MELDPEDHLTQIRDITAAKQSRIRCLDTAKAVLTPIANDPAQMRNWLGKQGIIIDASSIFGPVNLAQLIIAWHLLPKAAQTQIAASKIVVYLRIPQADDVNSQGTEFPGGDTQLTELRDGSLKPVVRLRSRKYLVLKLDNDEYDEKQITARFLGKSYNPGWAFIVKSSTYSTLVTYGPNFSWSNLGRVFTITHELTHVQQDLFKPLYTDQQECMAQVLRFQILGNTTDVLWIFSNDPFDNIEPWKRPSLSDIARTDAEKPGGRWEYIGNKTIPITVTPTMSPRTTACIGICRQAGIVVGNGIDPKAFLRKIYTEILSVLTPVCSVRDSQDVYAPTIDPTWIGRYQGLQIYLSPLICNGLQGFGKIDPVLYDGTRSVLEAFLELLESTNTVNSFTDDERKKLRRDVIDLVTAGLAATIHGVQAHKMKTFRALQMHMNAMKSFPALLGNFSDYSNSRWTAACKATRDALTPLIFKLNGSTDFEKRAPQSVLESANRIFAKAAPRSLQEVSSTLTDLDCYVLGVPLGYFNLYTVEYDAETYATWCTCPEELVDRYKRLGPLDAVMMQQVLNQATYVSVRGIFEEGDVPDYVDKIVKK